MSYYCGNCKTKLARFQDKDGNKGYQCPTCCEIWYDWQIGRDLEWQRREDGRRTRRATPPTTERDV